MADGGHRPWTISHQPSAISHGTFSAPPGSILAPLLEDEAMTRTRNVIIAGTLVTLVGALGVGQHRLQQTAEAQAKGAVQAPRFEVDPMWPDPLPNHWVMGNTIGVGVDKNDHVYIIHRGGSLEPKEIYAAATPPAAECCLVAPPVIEFDANG